MNKKYIEMKFRTEIAQIAREKNIDKGAAADLLIEGMKKISEAEKELEQEFKVVSRMNLRRIREDFSRMERFGERQGRARRQT